MSFKIGNVAVKVGDLIVKHSGTRPLRVTNVYSGMIYARYIHNNRSAQIYDYEGIKFYETEENMSNVTTLYSFKKEDGSIGYGVQIGTNSDNKLVIEEKGSGEIILRSASEVEEVLPFTFDCVDSSGTKHQFSGATEVSVGDMLFHMMKDGFLTVKVTAVDTKFKGNTKKFRGVRLCTESVK